VLTSIVGFQDRRQRWVDNDLTGHMCVVITPTISHTIRHVYETMQTTAANLVSQND